MKKYVSSVVLTGLVIIGGVLFTACGGRTPLSSPAATTQTAGELAAVGATVFANHCAKCHGEQGQGITGPVLIGNSNTLDKYGTAQGLLDFIDKAMPLDAPGSLSQQDYLGVVSFLLVQNNFVSATTPLTASGLVNVVLK